MDRTVRGRTICAVHPVERVHRPDWYRPSEMVPALPTVEPATTLLLWLLASAVNLPRHPHQLSPEATAIALDQALAGLGGTYDGPDCTDRHTVALAMCVAKAHQTEAYPWVRRTLAEAGVVDWELFLDEIVAPIAGRYGRHVGFHAEKSHYRWVNCSDLPAPHEPGGLDRQVRPSWDRASRTLIGRRRAPAQTRRRWLESTSVSDLGQWPYLRTDWEVVLQIVKELWDAPGDTWTQAQVSAAVEGAPEDVIRGVRGLIADPIIWDPTWGVLGSGRNRSLALLRLGVDTVLVCDQ